MAHFCFSTSIRTTIISNFCFSLTEDEGQLVYSTRTRESIQFTPEEGESLEEQLMAGSGQYWSCIMLLCFLRQ